MMGDTERVFHPVFGQTYCRASPSTFRTLEPHLLWHMNLTPQTSNAPLLTEPQRTQGKPWCVWFVFSVWIFESGFLEPNVARPLIT